MAAEKNYISGNTTMLILRLLEEKDMYGYQIIEELARRSDDTFKLKKGTLYPLLHGLENDDLVYSYDGNADSARIRRYYHLTDKGRSMLKEKKKEWAAYSEAVNGVMEGGACCAL